MRPMSYNTRRTGEPVTFASSEDLKKKKKKKEYDPKILLDILLHPDFRTIDDNGKPYIPSDVVYERVSAEMVARGSDIDKKHVYTIVNENRRGFADLIQDAFKIEGSDERRDRKKNKKKSQKRNTSLDQSDQSFCSDSIHAHPKPVRSSDFNLVLSDENWQLIKPKRKIYNDRAYMVLQSGWTDLVAKRLVHQGKNGPCTFAFKKHNISESLSAKYYACLHGSCVQCGATFKGTIGREPPKGVDVIINCEIRDVREDAHPKEVSRQVKGKLREEIGDQLIEQKKGAATYRREEAARLKKFGDKNPPIIASAAVIRKLKEQRLLQQYGLEFANPALNLVKSAKMGKYAGSIHGVGVLDFFCMYWSPEQQLLYTARSKRNPEAFMTINATGGIATKGSSQDPPIFLFQCMIAGSEQSQPSFQFLTANQKALAVAYFLRTILSKGVPPPRTVVTDFGWAILIGVAEVCSRCADLRDYLQKCYNVAALKKPEYLPYCYIRLDVSHLIAMVGRWKCLKGKERCLVRRFYLRCVGQAYQIDSLITLRDFLESVLVVALSRYIGADARGRPLISDTRMQSLNDAIKGVNIKVAEVN